MNGPGPGPPDRPARGGLDIPGWTAFVVFGFAVTMGYAASGLALYAVAWLEDGKVAPESTAALARAGATIPGLLAIVGAIAATEILVVLSALRSLRAPAREALRLGPSAAGPGALTLAAISMLLLSHGLDTSLHLVGLSDDGTIARLKQTFHDASPATLLVSVTVVGLLAGTAEELLFRGFMQTRLTARWGPVASVAVTSVFFGLAHFDAVQGSAAMLLGIYLGAITEWSGSLRPAILCHILNNILGTIGPAIFDAEVGPSFHYASLAVSAGGLAFLLPWLHRHLRQAPLRAE